MYLAISFMVERLSVGVKRDVVGEFDGKLVAASPWSSRRRSPARPMFLVTGDQGPLAVRDESTLLILEPRCDGVSR